jgi:hypothetical protein
MTRPLEEDAPARTRHAAEAFLERLPEAALQVDHLETQDRGEPCAHRIRTVAFDFRVSGIGDELNLGSHPLYW